MKCPRCGAEMKIKNVKADTDIYGNIIYNKYAYCYHCRIKRNLGQEKSTKRNPRRLSVKRARQRRRKVILASTVSILLLALTGGGIFLFRSKDNSAAKNKDAIVTDARKNKISQDSYRKLETGMTFEEVSDIIGNDGNKLMQLATEDTSAERYQWTGDKGNGAVILIFKDEKLIQISQSGMTKTASASLSKETARKITYGMTYDEVAKLIGAEGAKISETIADGRTNTMYTWHDSNHQTSVTVVFQDQKVLSAN